MAKILTFFYLLISLTSVFGLQIDKVVIWGHKLHSHTHSYIHYAFYRAFKEMNYEVSWFDDSSNPENFNYANTLFIVAANVDCNVPLRDDCYYIYHHCWSKEHQCAREKYGALIDQNRCISIKCFWKPYLNPDPDWERVEPFIYKNRKQKECVFPWATDLLPREIDREIASLAKKKKSKKQVCFLGTISDSGYGANRNELDPFFKEAKKAGLEIVTNDPWAKPLSMDQNRKIMQESLLAPAIQGKWQRDEGFIPCRIFKAISYGQLGITNSRFVSTLFHNKIVYNQDTRQLFHDAMKALKKTSHNDRIELMRFVRDKHTYINRIQLLLDFLEELNDE